MITLLRTTIARRFGLLFRLTKHKITSVSGIDILYLLQQDAVASLLLLVDHLPVVVSSLRRCRLLQNNVNLLLITH